MEATAVRECTVHLKRPHEYQAAFINSDAKRKIVRAGRRSGKTVAAAVMAIQRFLAGQRVLYTAPTTEQIDTFWYEIKRGLDEPIRIGVYTKNETEHFIERAGTKNRIRAKTVWGPDMLRGDYGDLLIFDEWQLCNEDAWELVGAPMLLDCNGDAIFFYTPPSLRSSSVSKARDPRHAAKMFKMAQETTTGHWQAFHFTSHDNPYISTEALGHLIQDMSRQSYRQEILAEDDELELQQLVYGVWNEGICKVKRFDIPGNWDIYSGHDFGSANPAALFVARVKLPLPPGAPPYMRHGDLVVFEEYLPGAGYSTAQHAERFREITLGRNVVKRAGGSHQEDEIRQGYSAHGWPIQEPDITKVKAQIDRVIGLMELNKVYVFNDLYHYLKELMNCLWKLDRQGGITNEIDNEQRFHLCASAKSILSGFTPETVGSGRIISASIAGMGANG